MQVHLLKADKPFSYYEHLLKYALPEKQREINNIKNDNLKAVSLLSHLFARFMVSTYTKTPFAKVLFKYNEYGKPYIEKESFHFSVSHSHELIAFVAHTFPIGIDVEKICEKNNFSASRFFTSKEKECIENSPVRFFEIWTKKEAYIKMLGTGLSTALTSFDVTEDKINKMLFSEQYEDYFISICTEKMDTAIDISLTEVPFL